MIVTARQRNNVLYLPLYIAFAWHAATGCATEADHGFIRRTYTDVKGNAYKYVVFVPAHREPPHKLPVILFLNGWGENGNDGLRQISNNFGSDVWRMRGYFPFLAVCPQCSYVGGWSPGSENAAMAMAILDRALTEYGGDPERVCVTGASVGGAGALELASRYPSRFAAVVPVAVGSAGDLSALAAVGMPIWSFYNGKDEYNLADSARDMRRDLLKTGLSPLVTEFDSVGHNAWDSTYGPPILYHWILENDLKNRNPAPFRLISPAEVLKDWKQEGAGTWVAGEEELSSTTNNARGEALLKSPPLGRAGEFHFDVFLQRESTCRLVFLTDRETFSARTEILLHMCDAGVSGVRDQSTGATVPLDPVAERALRAGWNDIRFTWNDDGLKLLINGWPALWNYRSLSPPSAQIGLVMAPGDPPMRWRFLRLRINTAVHQVQHD